MSVLMTSAAANKRLRSMEDEKRFLCDLEKTASTYIETDGVQPVKPEYDFSSVNTSINKIDLEVVQLKHAINVFNCTTEIPELGMTIDQALIRMAQLTKRKEKLDSMRKKLPKSRRIDYGGSKLVEYTCTNYDLSTVKAEYIKVTDETAKLQMKIDQCHQTMTFEIDF